MDKLLWTSKNNLQNIGGSQANIFPTTFKSLDMSSPVGAHASDPDRRLSTGFPGESSPVNLQTSQRPPAPQVTSDASDDFEGMVGDLRRIFIGWLKKTELQLAREKALLEKCKVDFEEEKARTKAQQEEERRKDSDRAREERKRNEMEVQTQLRQIQVEREEARKRLDEERTKRRSEWEEENRKLLLEREKFRQQQEEFVHEKKRIADHNLATETMVELNVGGTNFQSSRSVLSQQPDSFLAGMVSGRHQVNRDKSGRIFIDRDGDQFKSIVNFLRNPSKPPTVRDSTESELLASEAAYYGIHFFPFPLVFAIGGHNGIEHLRAVEVLDATNECWRPCRSMATERVYFGGASGGSRLFVFGGQNLEYKALCETEIYDCLRDEWLVGPQLNVARRNCAGTSLDGRIYAVGGFDGSALLNSVEAYDPRIKNWAELAPMNTPRSSASAAALDGKIFVLGGSSGQRLNSVEYLDIKMNKWVSYNVCMGEARSAGACASVLNRLYAIGGTDNSQTIHASVEMLVGEEGSWSFRSNCQNPRMDLAACAVADSTLLAGGGQSTGGEVLNQTEMYIPELNEWQAAPAMLLPRYGHAHLSVSL